MHPLEREINESGHFLLIGDSSEERFPALSFAAYVQAGRTFTCFDLGGRTTSRGKAAGRPVVNDVAQLPADLGPLAIIWTKPRTAVRGVEVAKQAGCSRVWFSFTTGHRDAVQKARELDMTVVEIGRCPIYYLDGDIPAACKAHVALTKLTGTRSKPPQTDPDAKRREIW